MRKLLLAYLIVIATSAVVAAQTPSPSPAVDAGDIVRITTKLVQVDVVVADKKGNPVRDLSAKDFQLLQDGKPQKITAVSYVDAESAAIPSSDPSGLGVATRKNGSESPGRIFAFVVDDGGCGSSMWGLDVAKEAINRFIDRQMKPNDLVAIYRTRAGSSILQQYTSDPVVLRRAAKGIRWYPVSGALCGTADGNFSETIQPNEFASIGDFGPEFHIIETPEDRKRREYLEDTIQNRQVVGTVGVINYVIKGLGQAPGRKYIMLLADGLQIRNRQNQRQTAEDALRNVTDAANRAGIVINSFSLRGSEIPGMMEARDVVESERTTEMSIRRMDDARRAEEGLSVLASETAGDFYRGSGSLTEPIDKILSREKGYYLVAYEPAEETFVSKKFNNIDVKVNTPGLKVWHRSGFIGVADEEPGTNRASGYGALYDALAAPLPHTKLNVALTAHFVNKPSTGNKAPATNVVRALVQVGGSELTFADDADGGKRVDLDIVAVTLDERNEVIDTFLRKHTLHLPASAVERIRTSGLVYSADVPVRMQGTYNFRVAIRDNNGQDIGTANELVTIPDLKRAPIVLSGLAVSGVDINGKFISPAEATVKTALSVPPSPAVPAIRRFRSGAVIAYMYTVYKAKLDSSGRPNLTVKVDLYRDNKLVVEGAVAPADLRQQSDWQRINDFGYLRLTQVPPGEYALKVTVTDLLAKSGTAPATGWIDLVVDK